jgi:NAD(P)-dependent dehydrogenase (short-subunit alcohol dehydrogenase family)
MPRDAVLITGGNSGIGFECARVLARSGLHVVIASRDRAASRTAVRAIADESGAESIEELGLDLGSLAKVRTFASELVARDLRLRALVCNAGLQVQAGPRPSADGFETTFAVNHLGHFLLVNLLLAQLGKAAPARIVVVASGVHDPAQRTGMPKAKIGDLETLARSGEPLNGRFDGRLAYVNSKLCNLWFVYELARRLGRDGGGTSTDPITVTGFDPGLVPGSGLARDYPAPMRFVWNHLLPAAARVLTNFLPTINPAPKAGAALARLVTDPDLRGVTGTYFPSHSRWQPAPSSDASYDEARAAALWDASVKWTGLVPGDSKLAGH